jgi:hypothetical protein
VLGFSGLLDIKKIRSFANPDTLCLRLINGINSYKEVFKGIQLAYKSKFVIHISPFPAQKFIDIIILKYLVSASEFWLISYFLTCLWQHQWEMNMQNRMYFMIRGQRDKTIVRHQTVPK